MAKLLATKKSFQYETVLKVGYCQLQTLLTILSKTLQWQNSDKCKIKEGSTLRYSKNIYEKKNSQVRHETNRNEYKVIEEELSDKFGTKVKIKNNKIEIHFVNPNDLNRILEIIGLDN